MTVLDLEPSRVELEVLALAAARASACATASPQERARQRADALATTWLLPTAFGVGLYDVLLLLGGVAA